MSDKSGNFVGLACSQLTGCGAIISVQQALQYLGRIIAACLSYCVAAVVFRVNVCALTSNV